MRNNAGGRKMFFDKLWVRIKGELLTFREDFPGAQEIREKGEQLLQKLESRMKDLTDGKQRPDSGHAQSGEYSEKGAQTSSLQDIEMEWDELLNLRKERQRNSEDSETTTPSPRKLG
jgi:hypothetical protein